MSCRSPTQTSGVPHSQCPGHPGFCYSLWRHINCCCIAGTPARKVSCKHERCFLWTFSPTLYVFSLFFSAQESRRLSLVYSLLSAGSAVFTLVGNVILILAVDTLQEDYFFEDGERAFVFFNTAMSVWIIVTLLVQLYCTLVGLSLYLHIKYDEDQQQVMVPYMIAPPTLSPSAVPPTMSGVYAGNDPAKQNSTTA